MDNLLEVAFSQNTLQIAEHLNNLNHVFIFQKLTKMKSYIFPYPKISQSLHNHIFSPRVIVNKAKSNPSVTSNAHQAEGILIRLGQKEGVFHLKFCLHQYQT